jgi:hypothetical protein
MPTEDGFLATSGGKSGEGLNPKIQHFKYLLSVSHLVGDVVFGGKVEDLR